MFENPCFRASHGKLIWRIFAAIGERNARTKESLHRLLLLPPLIDTTKQCAPQNFFYCHHCTTILMWLLPLQKHLFLLPPCHQHQPWKTPPPVSFHSDLLNLDNTSPVPYFQALAMVVAGLLPTGLLPTGHLPTWQLPTRTFAHLDNCPLRTLAHLEICPLGLLPTLTIAHQDFCPPWTFPHS